MKSDSDSDTEIVKMARRTEEILVEVSENLRGLSTFNQQLLNQLNHLQGQGGQGGYGQAQRDEHGRTRQEAHREYLDFGKNRPTFERGKNRWTDFAQQFNRARADHRVTE